ncbi:MAG TPA: hypothetical protein PLA46_07330 [Phycicoccus sp.]|nr:hypothetical protein [Phycicoccus sp.]HQV91378.1 hypothetical protein [Phycicoccus sp.]HQY95359.1 hypothetical protein [Phycicoccus sp.]HRA43461.1 hypothetical protein [Phycicoccus sp.]
MTWVALWLLAIGAMDLLRGVVQRKALAPAVGAVVLVVAAGLVGLATIADWLAVFLSLVPLVGWWWASERAQGQRGRDHVLALGSLTLGALGLLAFSGWASAPGGVLGQWFAWADLPIIGADAVSADALGRILLVTALVLTNLSTGNIVVRLVLVSVGAMRPRSSTLPQPADRLRGGRLLGPMERLLILGLGLAGQLTAAGLVIGAKGLIRFPELQSKAKDGSSIDGVGIDEMTEYFLIGSFVSWLVALGSLALTA